MPVTAACMRVVPVLGGDFDVLVVFVRELDGLDVPAADGSHQERRAVLGFQLRIGAARDQRLHGLDLVGFRGEHQRRLLAGDEAEEPAATAAAPAACRRLGRAGVRIRALRQQLLDELDVAGLRRGMQRACCRPRSATFGSAPPSTSATAALLLLNDAATLSALTPPASAAFGIGAGREERGDGFRVVLDGGEDQRR